MSVRRTLALAVGAALLLAGCGGDPEPRFEPTPSPSPSESETSAEPEAQTPEEFIREWFRLNTEMQNSGETQDFMAVSRGCDPCKDLATRVERIYADGGFIRIDQQQVEQISPGAKSATIRQFDVTVVASPTEYRERRGGKLQSYDGGQAEVQVTLVKKRGAWSMENLRGAT